MRDILTLLSDSQFHSGEELGKEIGVSRAAIWKKLKKLESIGVRVHSVKGRGYRLPNKLTLLEESRLRDEGLNSTVSVNIQFETGSTNGDLKQYINQNGSLPALFVCERQVQGKGRRGRSWEGGVARNIIMSFAWGFEGGVAVVEGLSLAVGVAVANVLDELGIAGVGLKWPNDVQVEGKKIAGILLEMVADQDACQVIVGIGLNVEMLDDEMSAIDQPWTDLASRLPQTPDRNRVLALLANELVAICENFSNGKGIEYYQKMWQKRDVMLNQPVTVTSVGQQLKGTARGIDAHGALLLERDGKIESLHGGEVSVRRQNQ
ncbi:biotin--[acetyl-CoA-carboxylase] ligase [Marinomonas mediterranea]|jgi:birA, biotin-[acetyl-CoA-carboxylase] ligase region|uniref:Bifunctional ligase/repressor BirA n=1 Tax=Marinomonas mediterranea (strain ATCC 700492 / JCM 21426 / NBRC 103028 / MMB-1) TaxID=717774 RepID=F2JX07_MARM1|nr:biotin--[acetyl-CoA-carboxylase] ligase [Marinomonas mediterranea]ADZ89526.1 biotin/acetyl-CoA-carboxylase ligase [Marinomonas mediterranea MMB-1]WCN11722.1 biotin--[acetyl-CoA-carboxylase] ligase [Marinomonas mediterranea]WCN15770.1 biotin--[acetyl-CoA-carboxylase] ligase [Marinomonas mediterranea MMB-1]